MTREQFIQSLRDKGLVFGWYNGEFITLPDLIEII